jgi:Zn-dependent protease with chaperone function
MIEPDAPVEGAAVYFDGKTARRRSVMLRLADALEIREGAALDAIWPFDSIRRADGGPGVLRISSRGASELARIDIADAELQSSLLDRCRNIDGEGAANSGNLRQIVGWSLAAAISIALIAIFGVPAGAQRLTALIPASAEERLGEAAANQVDAIFGKKVCEDPGGLKAMRKLAGELAAEGGLSGPVAVNVRESKVANAFAIPGARVHMLSALIDKANNPDELAGVLAHEFGHVAHRDSLREMISSGSTGFFFGLLLGDVSGSGAVILASRTLLNAAHSREAESAADAFAAKVMRGLGRSPAPLGEFLIRMTGQQAEGPIALLASHPLSQDRLAELKRGDQPATGPPLLDDEEWKSLKAICNATSK